MKNLTEKFIAEDTLAHYEETIQKLIEHARSLGLDTVYISAVMDNPDGTTEETRKMLVNNMIIAKEKEGVNFLLMIKKHIDKILETSRGVTGYE